MIDRFGNCKGCFTPEPYPRFQGVIDGVLKKDQPYTSIPWPAASPPKWALDFRPRHIVDLGCAIGRFTSSALTLLGSWGCLSALHLLTLVEKEPGFDGSSASGALDSVRFRCANSIRGNAPDVVNIDLRNVSVQLNLEVSPSDAHIMLGDERLSTADLIIASHFTYYFPNGGRSLLRALSNVLAKCDGLGWIVVRKRDCPIYRSRSEYLKRITPTAEEETYAEDLELWIRGASSNLELIDVRDQHFLFGKEMLDMNLEVVNLLLWRKTWLDTPRVERDISAHVAASDGPLFGERHFIVRSR